MYSSCAKCSGSLVQKSENRLRVIEGKTTEKYLKGSKNRFELAGFRVIGVKITVNIWGKSKGNQFCFELAGNSSYREFEFSGFNCSSNQRLGKCVRPKGGRRGSFWCSFIFPTMPSFNFWGMGPRRKVKSFWNEMSNFDCEWSVNKNFITSKKELLTKVNNMAIMFNTCNERDNY